MCRYGARRKVIETLTVVDLIAGLQCAEIVEQFGNQSLVEIMDVVDER